MTRYRSTMNSDPLKITVEVEIVDGQPECRSLKVESLHKGAPLTITGATLRGIPLASYLNASLEGTGFPFSVSGEERTAVSTTEMISKRKRRPKSEVLPQVVDAYRRALVDKDPSIRAAPTQHVANELHYERGHISRILSEARKQGLLGPARPGRPGESLDRKQELDD